MNEEWNCKSCNYKELESFKTSVLLGNFWCKAIFRTQFALLLFLRGFMSSILSFVTGLSFVVKNLCLKKQVLVTYSNCSQTFFVRDNAYTLLTKDFFCINLFIRRKLWHYETCWDVGLFFRCWDCVVYDIRQRELFMLWFHEGRWLYQCSLAVKKITGGGEGKIVRNIFENVLFVWCFCCWKK